MATIKSAMDAVVTLPASSSTVLNVDVDWLETPDSFIFKADIPGFRKDEIWVELKEGNVLQIGGASPFRGSFFRQFKLPCGVVKNAVKASDEAGVLTVVVPKKPALRKISVISKL